MNNDLSRFIIPVLTMELFDHFLVFSRDKDRVHCSTCLQPPPRSPWSRSNVWTESVLHSWRYSYLCKYICMTSCEFFSPKKYLGLHSQKEDRNWNNSKSKQNRETAIGVEISYTKQNDSFIIHIYIYICTWTNVHWSEWSHDNLFFF